MLSERLKTVDPDVYEAILNEQRREQEKIILIASENYASPAILEAQGSIFTNKYAEGYPGRRYYGGCDYADIVENLAITRARELFKAEHVNVQPHSGTQANMAVFFSVLKPGDMILGMNLDQGGHLSHGAQVNFSGFFYKGLTYGVNMDTGYIDYGKVRRLAIAHKPRMIIAGASAYSRIIDFETFAEIAREVKAFFVADIAHIAGLIAAGIHPSPIPYADFVTTTTHKTLRGPRGGMIMCRAEFGKAIDKMIFPGIQGGPLMHVIAAKAFALKEALGEPFREYQRNVVKNAKALAGALIERGFTIVSRGTDTHLMLVDLTKKEITGKEAEEALDFAGITVNKNAIPYDTKRPSVTSGLRLGTPSVTTRGMGEREMSEIGDIIAQILHNVRDQSALRRLNECVKNLCKQFPIYP
jgi:glycine hydroxymethyltransferase